MNEIETVKNLWSLFDERKFVETKPLFHENLEVHWITSKEVFTGADIFIAVNEEYPGSWRTIPVKIAKYGSGTADGNAESNENKVFSLVHVFAVERTEEFYVTSFFEFKDGLIKRIEEYWSTVENPPEWREKYRI